MFISWEAAITGLYKLPCKIDADGYRWVLSRDVAHMIDDVSTADVRPVAEISDAVDDAVDFLSSVHTQMPYHVYSALFDLICGICPNCGADMREVTTDG